MLRSLALVGTVVLVMAAREVLAAQQECMDINATTQVNHDDVVGMWYPTEIVLHRDDSKIYGVPIEPECPVVTFSLVKSNRRTLNMVWNTTDNHYITYNFQQKGNVKGTWTSTGEQSGPLVTDDYRHYGGVVRVLKLDENYMFLIFCSLKYRLLSTVAFSREETMPADVLEDGLATVDRKFKRAREIRLRPCQEDEDDSGRRIVASCLFSILPSLVVRFVH